MGRKLKSHFDLLKSLLLVLKQQQKCNHNSCAARLGDEVYARDFRQGKSWVSGKIVKCLGPVSLKVLTDNDGQKFRRHQDHLRKRSSLPLTWSVPLLTQLKICQLTMLVYHYLPDETLQETVICPNNTLEF